MVILLMVQLFMDCPSDAGQAFCPVSPGVTQIIVWPYLYILYTAFLLETSDRKAYVDQKNRLQRQATQLKLATLESKAKAEESLMSFLCHEIRNPCEYYSYTI